MRPGRRAPLSTYRLQLTPKEGFSVAAQALPYLARLGVSHIYCSPWLAAAGGSQHGYDVVDHSRVNPEIGGAAGLTQLASACREYGLGLVLDVVPNHSAVGPPQSANPAWWDVLRLGPDSAYARWFDIDWDGRDNVGRVLVPVLGGSLAEALAAGEVVRDGDLVRYHEHVLPLAPDSEERDREGDEDLAAVLARQHWRLCHWQVAAEELNYRRFFDVTTLAGVRVEDEDVFMATHAVVLDQVADGTVDGLRIDHPDGLADPGGYLARLAEVTDGAWVVVEKILEPGEDLPAGWACAGTTGYDALSLLTGLFLDPGGEAPLTTLYAEITGQPARFRDVALTAKREMVDTVLAAELSRLAEALVAAAWDRPAYRDLTRRGLRQALAEVLAQFPVYRGYVRPGEVAPPETAAVLDVACTAAVLALPGRAAEIATIRDLVVSGPAELVVRFQQTCGPVMAKGVEDTALYRYHRLVALNEVGIDPGSWGTTVAAFHASCTQRQVRWPFAMTTLSTHDTKRSEDVRARLLTLSARPREWAEAVAAWTAAAAGYRGSGGWPDRNAEYLALQTLVGAWPINGDRLAAYLGKATREAKQHTAWVDGDPAYDAELAAWARAVAADPEITGAVADFVERLRPAAEATALGQKLVQLTMPGVPDTYQGQELWDRSLVDPDNRRPVDYALRSDLLGRLDRGEHPGPDDQLGTAKLLVTSRALRLRREHPEWFGEDGAYAPLAAHGPAADHVVAFARAGRLVTVVARLTDRLGRAGGWRDTTIALPAGSFRDALAAGSRACSGVVGVAELLGGALPVALLVQQS